MQGSSKVVIIESASRIPVAHEVMEPGRVWLHLNLVRDRLSDQRRWNQSGWFNRDFGNRMCLANTLRHVAFGDERQPRAMSGDQYLDEAERLVAEWVRVRHRTTIPVLNDSRSNDVGRRYQMVMRAVEACIKLVEPEAPVAVASRADARAARREDDRRWWRARRAKPSSSPARDGSTSPAWDAWIEDLRGRGFEFSRELEQRFRLLDGEQSTGDGPDEELANGAARDTAPRRKGERMVIT